MAFEFINIKSKGTVFSSKNSLSNAVQAEEVKVKSEPESEEDAESNDSSRMTCSLSTAEGETRKIKEESFDTLSDQMSPSENVSLCAGSSYFVETGVVIKEEKDPGIDAGEECRFAQVEFDSFTEFENKDDPLCCDEANLGVKMNQGNERNSQVPFILSSVESKDYYHSVSDCAENDGLQTSTPVIIGESRSFSRTSVQTKQLRKELVVIHASEKPFACTECSSKFKYKSHLNIHLTTHSYERPFACPYCPLKFKNQKGLIGHLVTHRDKKPFSCTHCLAKFSEKWVLKRHLVSHFDEKRFSCSYCKSKFKTKNGLKVHLVTHSDERPFSCPRCSVKLKNRNRLNLHLVSHSEERRFACPHCPSKFKQRNVLKTHLLVHSNERPFSCSLCSLKFKSKKYLEAHLPVHSTERRSFLCPHCSSSFRFKFSLHTHLLEIHPEKGPVFGS